jgi:uncharacterized protein (UPF0335 family)
MTTEKDFIAKLSAIYMQEESLAEEAKEIKSKAKDAGFDAASLSAVAKAIVKNKVDELKEKSEAMVRLIQVARN